MEISCSAVVPIQVASRKFMVYFDNMCYCVDALRRSPRHCEIVIVDYISALDIVPHIQKICTEYSCSYVRPARVDTIWSRGRALNDGAKAAKGNILFFIDTDCVCPPDYFNKHLEKLHPGNFTFSEFYNTKPGVIKTGKYDVLLGQKDKIKPPLPDSHSHIAIYKKTFFTAGAYDEIYRGWGAEDDDIFHRLRSLGHQSVFVDSRPIHLFHPTWQELMDSEGKKEEQEQTLRQNREIFYSRLNKGFKKK
jgi:predicted glycosyltransferase involved in capsule biosynthesis